MRITSGILKGRIFKVPEEGMRPTKEQVREAIFSSLAARVPGARVLDLFAGSGGLGLEAWSRSAASVTVVEKNPEYWKILEENFRTLGNPDLGGFQAVQADVYDFLKHGAEPFDLIIADPPYDEADLPKLLETAGNALAEGGLLVFEMRSSDTYSISFGWALTKEKTYGETKVLFLEREA